MKYVAFADESYITQRYRSIGLLTFPENKLAELNSKLTDILGSSGVKEFKWKKLRDAKYRFCAEKIINFVIKNLHKHDLRLDVLIWDTQDKRHKVQHRDDVSNFERMFFHLLNSSMKRRAKNAKWSIYPDERIEIDWKTVEQCLSTVGLKQEYIKSPLLGNFFTDKYYEILEFKQVKSHNTLCCQVADLFAGISVFSKTKFGKYNAWEITQRPNLRLFKEDKQNITQIEEERFKIINLLDSMCKERKLGVSLKSRKCFMTCNPNRPVNFWHYVPQHDKDKAPTKKG